MKDDEAYAEALNLLRANLLRNRNLRRGMSMKAEAVRGIADSQRKLSILRPERVRTEYQSKIEWLLCKDINTKEHAQRPFEPGRAADYAANFDPDKLGFPGVWATTTRTGAEQYYSFDGQHRIAATMIALGDNQQIQCEVVRGIDLARAAELFLGRNDAKPVRTIDKFLVGVTAKRPECVAITAIVGEFDLKIGRSSSESTISAVASLQRIYRADGTGDLLRRTLTVAIDTWGRDMDTFIGDVLRGLSLLIERHGDTLEIEALQRKMRSYKGGCLGLLGRARTLTEAVGGRVADGVARALVIAYNTGRSKGRLPGWGEKN